MFIKYCKTFNKTDPLSRTTKFLLSHKSDIKIWNYYRCYCFVLLSAVTRYVYPAISNGNLHLCSGPVFSLLTWIEMDPISAGYTVSSESSGTNSSMTTSWTDSPCAQEGKNKNLQFTFLFCISSRPQACGNAPPAQSGTFLASSDNCAANN